MDLFGKIFITCMGITVLVACAGAIPMLIKFMIEMWTN